MVFAIIHVSLLLSLCFYCHPGPFMHHHFPLHSSWLQSCPIPSLFQCAASSFIPPLTCSSVTVKEKSYICTLSHETAWLISWQSRILWLWCRRVVPEPGGNDVIHYSNDASGRGIITWELYMPLWSVTGLFLLHFLCLGTDWVRGLTAHTHTPNILSPSHVMQWSVQTLLEAVTLNEMLIAWKSKL